MFLPRHTPFHANQRPSIGRAGSSSSMVSVQVHESILAAKARDMSREYGLGLADENAEVMPIDDQDNRGPGAGVSQDVVGKQIETHVGVDVPTIFPALQTSSPMPKTKRGVDHLFVGARSSSEQRRWASVGSSDSRQPKRHSTKRASLRGYAEARWARQQGMTDRVLRATNIAKLEWEAKAALLHHSYPLAILLLFRAASLGSVKACEQLADLYAYGVTRGVSPVVTLIYRDALRSIAWTLDALRFYERRIGAQIKTAESSATRYHRLTRIWQGPLQAAKLLVRGLLDPEVGAFDPCQKNAIFLPRIDDLNDSQCAWTLRAGPKEPQSARQPAELWMELEDANHRWTSRLDTAIKSESYHTKKVQGPDDSEEYESFRSVIRGLSFHFLTLRAIQLTRFLTLEPYGENVEPVGIAWSKAAAVKTDHYKHCPDPSEMLQILSRAKRNSGRIYDEQLFRDLSSCAQMHVESSMAAVYKHRNLQSVHKAQVGGPEAMLQSRSSSMTTQNKDRLRDLAPADVETARQMEACSRPVLTMRLSSGYAAPQAAVASISASGEQRTPMPPGSSASETVRQKYGRTVSTSSIASASRTEGQGSSEPTSPTDTVRTTFSLGVARSRRPSSVVSITPSLLFPSEALKEDANTESARSSEIVPDRTANRARSSSSTQLTPHAPVQRPRVTSLYSSPPALATSTSRLNFIAPSASTTSQQNLHALASANPTAISVQTRSRTGSNASLGSLNPRLGTLVPKTSPSISEMPEGSTTFDSALDLASYASNTGTTSRSAAADTLRRLKGRRSHTDLRTIRAARTDSSFAPSVPSSSADLAEQPADEVWRASHMSASRSRIFTSLDNLPDERLGNFSIANPKATKTRTVSTDSARERLATAHERVSQYAIHSVLEEGEVHPIATAHADGPPFTSALAAGALSGLTVDLLFFPIDTIKTRLQSAQGFWAAGGFIGVYRGLASTAVGSAPGAAVFFTTYESMKPALVRWMPSVFGPEGSLGPAGVHMASASIAEIAACLIRVPTEVIKSRQQTMTYGTGTTTFQAFKKVFQEAGIRGYYRGFGSTVGREIPFTCIQFPLYERLKLEMARSRAKSQSTSDRGIEVDDRLRPMSDHELVRHLPTWQAGLAGSIAGAIAAGLTTPLDVVKTRIMLHTKRSAASASGSSAAATVAETLPRGVNTDIIPTLLHIGRTEGVKTLFSGFVPRTMWIGLGGAVFLGTFDAGIKTLS